MQKKCQISPFFYTVKLRSLHFFFGKITMLSLGGGGHFGKTTNFYVSLDRFIFSISVGWEGKGRVIFELLYNSFHNSSNARRNWIYHAASQFWLLLWHIRSPDGLVYHVLQPILLTLLHHNGLMEFTTGDIPVITAKSVNSRIFTLQKRTLWKMDIS